MNRCFELAEEARKRGDGPVGSLLVDLGGLIIAEEGERNITEGIFAHAEILTIINAINAHRSNDLDGYTLYTTNEPCFMCTFAIRQTKISRVVFARKTFDIGGISSNYPILAATNITNWGNAPEVVHLESAE